MNQSTIREVKRKKLVRVLAYPFEQIRRRLRVWTYQCSVDSRYIKSLQKTHLGDVCFVIGNGPSLTADDLDRLCTADIDCFASNRIYRIFPQTKWRPTYYLSMDIYVLAASFDEIRGSGSFPKFINYRKKNLGRVKQENIHYLCEYSNFTIIPDQLSIKNLSSDLSKYAAQNVTITVSAIELAIYMGYKTIYLLGVDNNYTHKRMPDGTIYVDPTVKSSYFSGGEPSKSAGVSVQPVELVNESYKIAKNFAEEHGVKIYNATRGGKLEVFERVNFDELMRMRTYEQ